MTDIIVHYFPDTTFGFGHIAVELVEGKKKYLVDCGFVREKDHPQYNSVQLPLPPSEVSIDKLIDQYKSHKDFHALIGKKSPPIYSSKHKYEITKFNIFNHNCAYFSRSFLIYAGYQKFFNDNQKNFCIHPIYIVRTLINHMNLKKIDRVKLTGKLYWLPLHRLLLIINIITIYAVLWLNIIPALLITNLIAGLLTAVTITLAAFLSVKILTKNSFLYKLLFISIVPIIALSIEFALEPKQVQNFWSTNQPASLTNHCILVGSFLVLLVLFLCQRKDNTAFFNNQLNKLQYQSSDSICNSKA
jgi:hypothetical protein